MAIEIREKIGRNGQHGLTSNGELPYVITGSNDYSAVKAALLAFVPATFDGNPFKNVRIDELYEKSSTDGIWDGVAYYETGDATVFEVGEAAVNFNIGGGTQHITQSKATRSSTVASGTATDFKQGINVTNDSVEGTDIIAGAFEFEVTQLYSDEQITWAYIQNLYLLANR